MQIRQLRIQNYQSHADTTVSHLGPVTVLVGPNGGGKSALFEGIRALSRILAGPVAQAFGPPPHSFEGKLFRGADQRVMKFDADFVDQQYPATVGYSINIGYTGVEDADAPPSILEERVEIDDTLVFDRTAKFLKVTGLTDSDIRSDLSLFAVIRTLPRDRIFKGPVVLRELARRVGSVVRYRLEPKQLSLPAQEPEFEMDAKAQVRMGYEGDNLAAVLYWLKEFHSERLESIIKHLQSVIPEIAGISFNFIGADRVGFSIEFSDARRAVLAANASSGTLLLLGLVTLLNVPSQPEIACIEEPETGLTPDSVRLFFKLLCAAAEPTAGHRRSQFLFSSHSPFVLVDSWNRVCPDRSFIKRLRIDKGRSVVEDFEKIISDGDSGAVLQKGKDGRTILGLKTAEELMCGRFLP